MDITPAYAAAIKAEALAWAAFFKVTDADQIAARERVNYANVKCDHVAYLQAYLPEGGK